MQMLQETASENAAIKRRIVLPVRLISDQPKQKVKRHFQHDAAHVFSAGHLVLGSIGGHMYLVSLFVACVAGRIRKKGGEGQNDCGSIERKGGGMGPAKTLLFFFFRPPDERKNPDWSDFMNHPIRHSDWSATCHSRAREMSKRLREY